MWLKWSFLGHQRKRMSWKTVSLWYHSPSPFLLSLLVTKWYKLHFLNLSPFLFTTWGKAFIISDWDYLSPIYPGHLNSNLSLKPELHFHSITLIAPSAKILQRPFHDFQGQKSPYGKCFRWWWAADWLSSPIPCIISICTLSPSLE